MDRRTKKLLNQLQHEDAAKRYEAVLQLGKSGQTGLIAPLDKVASLDDNEKVRTLAAKAVRTLRILKQREEEAQQKTAGEQKKEDPLEWNLLATRATQEDKRKTDEQSWTYDQAKEEQRRLKEQREAEELAAQKRARRVRARRRLIYWLGAVIGVLGLIIVAAFTLFQRDVEPLRTWAEDSRDVARAYGETFGGNTVDCAAVQLDEALKRPERPSTNFDNNSDFDEFFSLMSRVEEELEILETDAKNFCQESFETREIADNPVVARINNRVEDIVKTVDEALEMLDATNEIFDPTWLH